ncbi:MAG: Wadjet anti-phage system protein JetD domain-containing protein [Bdellovibrionales bacterium]
MTLLPLQDYFKKAERDYVLEGKTEFLFPIRAKPGEQDFYIRLDQELQRQSQIKVMSYRSVKEGWAKVSRPAAVGFDESVLLTKHPHLKVLRAFFEDLVSKFSKLPVREFLQHGYVECSQDPQAFKSALEVYLYLLEHRDEIVGLMPRQIPHGQSTKLIGRNQLLLRFFSYDLKLTETTWKDFFSYFKLQSRPTEFRFYAPSCACQGSPLTRYNGIMARDWIETLDFSSLKATLIVENIETFFQLVSQTETTLLIWGGGWKAAQLQNFLPRLPQPIFYWGDLDKEGYEIYGFLKQRHPQLQSVLMSHAILEKYRGLHQKKEIYTGPFRRVEGLQNEYEEVCLRGLQIEQEQIQEPWPFRPDLR